MSLFAALSLALLAEPLDDARAAHQRFGALEAALEARDHCMRRRDASCLQAAAYFTLDGQPDVALVLATSSTTARPADVEPERALVRDAARLGALVYGPELWELAVAFGLPSLVEDLLRASSTRRPLDAAHFAALARLCERSPSRGRELLARIPERELHILDIRPLSRTRPVSADFGACRLVSADGTLKLPPFGWADGTALLLSDEHPPTPVRVAGGGLSQLDLSQVAWARATLRLRGAAPDAELRVDGGRANAVRSPDGELVTLVLPPGEHVISAGGPELRLALAPAEALTRSLPAVASRWKLWVGGAGVALIAGGAVSFAAGRQRASDARAELLAVRRLDGALDAHDVSVALAVDRETQATQIAGLVGGGVGLGLLATALLAWALDGGEATP